MKKILGGLVFALLAAFLASAAQAGKGGAPAAAKPVRDPLSALSQRVSGVEQQAAGLSDRVGRLESAPAEARTCQECYVVSGDAPCAGTYALKGTVKRISQATGVATTNYFPALERTDGKYVLTVPSWSPDEYAIFCATNVEERWVSYASGAWSDPTLQGQPYCPAGSAAGEVLVDSAFALVVEGQGIPDRCRGLYVKYPSCMYFLKPGSEYIVNYSGGAGWIVIDGSKEEWTPLWERAAPQDKHIASGLYAPTGPAPGDGVLFIRVAPHSGSVPVLEY